MLSAQLIEIQPVFNKSILISILTVRQSNQKIICRFLLIFKSAFEDFLAKLLAPSLKTDFLIPFLSLARKFDFSTYPRRAAFAFSFVGGRLACNVRLYAGLTGWEGLSL